jgi:aryl-alcohol dehydrogenase-like predicted oxidoreductase
LPLDQVTLAPSSLATSRLGFGCAGLMRDPSARGRQAVLGAAFEAGVRHFDVARMYGLGAAEGELGRFARGRRDELVIATKFGIDPPSGLKRRLVRFQSPARALLARFPALRQAVKRRADGPAGVEPHRYDAAGARASLEASLRELGTDHVDLLLLHGPSPDDDVRTSEICAFLEEARAAGRVRAWGVSGAPDPSIALVGALGPEAVLQMHDDPWLRSTARLGPSAARVPVTFGVIAGPLSAVGEHLRRQPGEADRWSQAVGCDVRDPRAVASLALRWALRANPDGVVLFSTTRPDHVRAAAADAGRAPAEQAEQLDAFADLVASELPAPGDPVR